MSDKKEEDKKEITFEQLKGMRLGVGKADEYLFPGTEQLIQIRVLTKYELNKCDHAGRTKVKANTKTEENAVGDYTQDMLTDYIMYEVLYRGVLCGETGVQADKRFFATPEAVSELTVEEYEKLLEHYSETQERYSPMESAETEKDFGKLLEEVKKKSDPWKSLSVLTLRKLVVYLVENSETSQKGSGSTSSQSNQSKGTTKKNSTKILKAEVKELKLEEKESS